MRLIRFAPLHASLRYGGDMSGSGAQRSSWNVALMKDALAPCYAHLMLDLAGRLGPGERLYRCGTAAVPTALARYPPYTAPCSIGLHR